MKVVILACLLLCGCSTNGGTMDVTAAQWEEYADFHECTFIDGRMWKCTWPTPMYFWVVGSDGESI